MTLAFANNSLGEYLVTIKKEEEAISQFLHTISLFPENSIELELGYSFNNLGVLLGRKGDEGSSFPYKKRALEIFLHHLGKDHPYIGTLYNNVGMSYQKLGNYEEESHYLIKALESHKKHYAPCSDQLYSINNNLGISYRNIKEFDKAEEHIQTALHCIGEANIKSDPRYVSLLTILATIKDENKEKYSRADIHQFYLEYIQLAEQNLGKYHPAINGLYNNFGVFLTYNNQAKESLENFESFLYTRFPNVLGKKYSSYLTIDSLKGKYEFLALLTNLGSAKFNLYKEEKDFSLLQESNSMFELFDQLSSSLRPQIINSASRLDLKQFSKRGYVIHNRTLVEQYSLKQDPKTLEKIFQNTEKIRNWELLENFAFSTRSKEIASTDLAVKIDSLKNAMGISTASDLGNNQNLNLTFLIDKLKINHPEYYNRLYGQEVRNLTELQNFCLRKKQDWIIFFFKSDGQFSSMLINEDTVQLSKIPISNKMLSENKDRIMKSLRNKDWDFTEAAVLLYDALVAPFEDHLKTNNLVILPHSSLLDLPFSLLINKEKESDEKEFDYAYLMKDYNISYNYSASLAIETEKEDLTFSNPLFMAPTYNNQPLQYNFEEINLGRKEIGGRAIKGEKSTKKNFLDSYPQYDHLHFAGHISSNNTVDSIFLLMDQGNDSLFLNEIADLDSHSKLVVLSGCESALGESSPEAVISPAYGFTFAGSPNVIASMWKNNDESSSKIFGYFYALLKEGKSSTESLQMAKRQYLEKAVKPERHPVYWAPFVYYGQEVHWERKRSRSLYFAIAFIGILLLGGVIWKRRSTSVS